MPSCPRKLTEHLVCSAIVIAAPQHNRYGDVG
jgi:hypothetical protein